MKLALAEAQKAAKAEETPIGAVVVAGGRVIAAAHNTREHSHDITAHAELLAVRAAAKEKGDWRLTDCTVYVTLEPSDTSIVLDSEIELPTALLMLCEVTFPFSYMSLSKPLPSL